MDRGAVAKAAHPRHGTVEPGDEVYVHHPERGPLIVRVLACGRDGITGECDRGARHGIPYDRLLGHRKRVPLEYRVVDAGVGGAIVEDKRGRRRFIEGDLTPEAAADPTEETLMKDPLLDGLDRLAKALDQGAVAVIVKAGRIKGAPGLALRDLTDRAGHHTRRWMRTTEDPPKGRERGAGPSRDASPPGGETPPVRHGDVVLFRHGMVRGRGRVIASGRDGVTVRDDAGRTHQVRHDDLEGPAQGVAPQRPAYPPRKPGQDDRAYFREHVDAWPDPDHLPDSPGRYFNDHEEAELIPLDRLEHTTEGRERDIRMAPKLMAAAYHGVIGKRNPITVEEIGNGRYRVVNGNGTTAAAKKHGWKALPARVVNRSVKQAEEIARSLVTEKEQALPRVSTQPVREEEELFARAATALEELKTWLDKGNGVCSRAGHRLMNKSPDDVTQEEWANDEGMLFIAPLKGRPRSREKVAVDYGGDWSMLRDVVRCSIALPTMKDIAHFMGRLRDSGMMLAQRPKNRFAEPVPVGYRDLLLNVRLPSGIIAEVQVHAKPMLAAKEQGHHWYAVQRSIEAKCRAENREPTPEEARRITEAEEKQKAIYEAAWRKAAGEREEGMTKALRPGAKAALAAGAAAGTRWEYFEHDGALYRRPAGAKLRGVTDVLHDKTWRPYKGDALKPALFGTPIKDPDLFAP